MRRASKENFLEWIEENCDVREGLEDTLHDLYHDYIDWNILQHFAEASIGNWVVWMRKRFIELARMDEFEQDGKVHKRRFHFVGIRRKRI